MNTRADIANPGSENSILVVEDDPAVLSITTEILGTMGLRVTQSRDFASALSIWNDEGGRFGLVILDYNLLDHSGSELAERFLKEHPTVRILMMTGFSLCSLDISEPLRKRLSFIEKPYTVAQLRAAVRALLDSREASTE